MFWSYEGNDPPHSRERVVPTGTMQLIVNLREEELRLYDRQDHRRFQSLGVSLISGTHSRFVVIDTASRASTVGVHFKAGGAQPFLGVSAGELHDANVPLDALWGTKATELRDRLLEAQTPEVRFGVQTGSSGASRTSFDPPSCCSLRAERVPGYDAYTHGQGSE